MNEEKKSCHECTSAATKQVCPQCHTAFVCDLAQGNNHCWCMKLPAIMPVCSTATCLCENCLRSAIEDKTRQQTNVS